jgi:HisA/HisF family protein
MQSISPVIPVLDLMIGQIVLAQGGDRGNYFPVHSRLSHSSQPLDVARAMFNQTNCETLYLADIDSFAGAQPNWSVYNELLDYGFGLWVDADWVTSQRGNEITAKIKHREKFKVIVSSETLSSQDETNVLAELIEQGLQPIFSLDRKAEKVITRPGPLEQATSIELAELAYQQGVREMIVLDLDAVGTNCGPNENNTLEFIESLRNTLGEIRITTGGGIRDTSDVQRLIDGGCDHVLVATAIHECRMTPFEIAEIGPKSNIDSA